MRLNGKVAFITGGGSGIGAGVSRMFVKEGAKVILAARNMERLEKFADELRAIGGEVLCVQMDQGDEAQVKAAIDQGAAHFGKLDVLINNAGPTDLVKGQADGPVAEVDSAAFDRIVKVSMYGPFWCAKYAVPHMIKAGKGSVVNISSIAAVTGFPRSTAYGAAKAGLISITRSIAFDYGDKNIRANAIITGYIKHENSDQQTDTAEKEAAYKGRHMTRLGNPDDMAYACVYLASDESDFVTATTLDVEGGTLKKSRPDAVLIKP